MLKAGIVGLPNVGKSTLFNALLRAHKAPAENYPFCTIDPNLGVVEVPDPRLDALVKVTGVPNRIPTTIEFLDIAGLVRGASKGEGLGNRFLSHIREVDAIIHVVRCFEDPDVHHVTGSVDPVKDIEIVTTELVLADLETVTRRRERLSREVKQGHAAAVAEDHALNTLIPQLEAGKTVLASGLAPEDLLLVQAQLLTAKPTLYVANIKESEMANAATQPHVKAVATHAGTKQGCATLAIAAQLESDLADLDPPDAQAYLAELQVTALATDTLIARTYELLGLRTFFTFNRKECRAWTIPTGATASQAAGKIHTDFERGFIKAEAVPWKDLVECGSVAHAREKGHYRVEGRDYLVQDGDVLLFKFNV